MSSVSSLSSHHCCVGPSRTPLSSVRFDDAAFREWRREHECRREQQLRQAIARLRASHEAATSKPEHVLRDMFEFERCLDACGGYVHVKSTGDVGYVVSTCDVQRLVSVDVDGGRLTGVPHDDLEFLV